MIVVVIVIVVVVVIVVFVVVVIDVVVTLVTRDAATVYGCMIYIMLRLPSSVIRVIAVSTTYHQPRDVTVT